MSNDETVFAQGRLPERTYISRSFVFERQGSSDDGEPARFVYKVFDEETGSLVERAEGEEWIVRTTPGGRKQIKLLVVRDAGRVKELWIQNVPAEAGGTITQILNLKEDDATRLVDLLKALHSIPVEGGDTVRVDDSLIRELFSDPDAAARIYEHEPSAFAELIAADDEADDVVAVAARRRAVAEFRRMLEDDEHFDQLVAANPRRSDEDVWQKFFERHSWMLGANLGFQLMTAWSEQKLEQVVAGWSIAESGKRVDALLRTSGRVRSMVFAEIKTHRTPLLARQAYRSGCWASSAEVVGGVAQAQGTVHLAVADIGARLQATDEDGADIPGDLTYLFRPRSYLVVGDLGQLQSDKGADHHDKIRSFEIFRRELIEPEVVSFDEVLARAEWIVDLADTESQAAGG